MCAIASAILRIVVFPHEGNLITVDQLNFTWKSHMETNESTIPLFDRVKPTNEILGVGMYSSLMGTFYIPSLVNYLVSTCIGKYIETVVDRIDPLVLPSCNETKLPLLVVDVTCQDIFDTIADPIMNPFSVS